MCGGIQAIVHGSLFYDKFNFYVSNKEKIFNIVGLPMSLLQILHFFRCWLSFHCTYGLSVVFYSACLIDYDRGHFSAAK